MRWGRYKAIHLLGFALFTLGMGLWTLLDENSPTGECMYTHLFSLLSRGLSPKTITLLYHLRTNRAARI